MKPTRGGKRPNSGAKKKAVKATTRSISMLPDQWTEFDRMRGRMARGAFVSLLLVEHDTGRLPTPDHG